jgi:hypothetical protein
MKKQRTFVRAAAALVFADRFAGVRAKRQQPRDHPPPELRQELFMPFSPAIKVKSGKMLWLAGGTALPVYHDHPHKREQIIQYMPTTWKRRRGARWTASWRR